MLATDTGRPILASGQEGLFEEVAIELHSQRKEMWETQQGSGNSKCRPGAGNRKEARVVGTA